MDFRAIIPFPRSRSLAITFSRILSRSRFRRVAPRLPFSRSLAQVPHSPCARACAETHARFSKLSWTKCHERFVSSPRGAPVCKCDLSRRMNGVFMCFNARHCLCSGTIATRVHTTSCLNYPRSTSSRISPIPIRRASAEPRRRDHIVAR